MSLKPTGYMHKQELQASTILIFGDRLPFETIVSVLGEVVQRGKMGFHVQALGHSANDG